MLANRLHVANFDAAVALARLPAGIKGFGPVKAAAAHSALARRDRLMTEFLGATVSAGVGATTARTQADQEAA